MDLDTGETVARDVTATLPHTDWLLEAHLSDGSTLTVTEDHRFWSVKDNGWVELQDLDPTDQLLTPDGAMVTVDWLDWNAGETAPAWDLTVEGVHNFFVAADATAEPVLVHNQDSKAAFCGVPVSPRHSALAGTDESLTPSQRSDLGLALRELGDESPSALDDVLDALVASGDDDTIRVLVGRAGEFPQQLKAAALKGWTDDYLTRPLLWTEDTLTFTGDVTRTVRFREPGPAVEDPANVWGVTDAHLNKHFFGPGDVSLGAKGLGDLPEWLDETQALLGSVARRTQTRTSPVEVWQGLLRRSERMVLDTSSR